MRFFTRLSLSFSLVMSSSHHWPIFYLTADYCRAISLPLSPFHFCTSLLVDVKNSGRKISRQLSLTSTHVTWDTIDDGEIITFRRQIYCIDLIVKFPSYNNTRLHWCNNKFVESHTLQGVSFWVDLDRYFRISIRLLYVKYRCLSFQHKIYIHIGWYLWKDLLDKFIISCLLWVHS